MRVVSANLTAPDHERLFAVTKEALEECLDLGRAEVERVCNDERERRLLVYGRLRPTDVAEPTMRMDNIKAQDAIAELTPPFALVDPPDPIVVDFGYARLRQLDPNRENDLPAMAVTIADLRLCVFTDAIDVARLRQRRGDAPLRDIVFHEFLHLCGDASRNGAPDGILRHNLAGADAIKARLAQP